MLELFVASRQTYAIFVANLKIWKLYRSLRDSLGLEHEPENVNLWSFHDWGGDNEKFINCGENPFLILRSMKQRAIAT